MQIAGATLSFPKAPRLLMVVALVWVAWAITVTLGLAGTELGTQSAGPVADLVDTFYAAMVVAGVWLWRRLFTLFT